jgi:hypothetical protein
MSFSQGFNVNNNAVYLSTQKIQEFSDKPIWNANQIQDISISSGPYSAGQTLVYSIIGGTGVFVPGTGTTGPTGANTMSGGITGSVQYNNGLSGFTGDSNLVYTPVATPFGGLSIGSNQTYKINNQNLLYATGGNLLVGINTPFNSTGISNTFIGYQAGSSNTTGFYNVFIGSDSAYSNTTAYGNVIIGYSSGYNNEGNTNVLIGQNSGVNNKGDNNVIIGVTSGFNNNADDNVFIGASSGVNNSTGASNTFIGRQAGNSNISGANNVFLGKGAGYVNSTGNNNTLLGTLSGSNNTSGINNTFVGYNSGFNVISQTGVVCIGINSGGTAAGFAGSSVVNDGLYFPPGLATMGSTGANVYYDTNTGQMGAVTSSLRFKENITDIEVDTSNIYNLRPVSYNYKNSTYRDFGLIAEEVNQYYPEIVPKDAEGPFSVNYDRITVLLLVENKKIKQELTEIKNRLKELNII